MRFYEQFYGFHALRTVVKCTIRHLFRYGGLKRNNNKKSEIPDVRNHAPLKSQSLDRQSRIKNQQSKSRIIRNKKINRCCVRLSAQSNFLRLRWFAVGFCFAHNEMIAVKSERASIETSQNEDHQREKLIEFLIKSFLFISRHRVSFLFNQKVNGIFQHSYKR